MFHCTKTMLDDFNGGDSMEVCIQAGSFVLFPRQVLHTFAAIRRGMIRISYQSPSLVFSDPGQFTLPRSNWTHGHDILASTIRLQHTCRALVG